MLKNTVSRLLSPPGPTSGMYQGGMPGVLTPQAKNIAVNTRMGNPNIAKQQGTTVQIYDSVPLDGRTTLEFFTNANSRTFPLTNMNQGNGMLQVGQSIVVKTAQILFVTIDPTTGAITATSELDTNLQFQQGEILLGIANQDILVNMKLQTWVDKYNKNALIPNYNVFHFDTMLTMIPLVKLKCEIKLPIGVDIDNTYAQLIIEGTGSILAPQTTF